MVSFTNHHVHPGSASTFEDISIRGVFCSKSKSGQGTEFDPLQSGSSNHALIWIDAPAVIRSLAISDFHRTESDWPAENIGIEPEATVECLQMSNISIINRTPGAIHVLTNKGTIGCLGMSGVYAKAIRNPNVQNGAARFRCFLCFGHLCFGFVSYFVLRISDFRSQ